MLHELTPEQLANVEYLVAAHYRTNIFQRIQWFESAKLLQVGAFITTDATVVVAEEAEEAEEVEEPEPEETEPEPYDDEAHEQFFKFASFFKTDEDNEIN